MALYHLTLCRRRKSDQMEYKRARMCVCGVCKVITKSYRRDESIIKSQYETQTVLLGFDFKGVLRIYLFWPRRKSNTIKTPNRNLLY